MDPLNLNIDIANHDASRPLLVEGQYIGQVVEAVVVPSKTTPGNFNLKITCATVEPAQSTKGTPLNPGYKLSRYLPLQASEAQKEAGMEDSYKDQIALVVDAVFNTKQGERPALSQQLITEMVSKPVTMVVAVRAAEGAYGEQNDLARILPAA